METTSQILKPDSDLKEYRFIELSNKIQAFIISTKKYLEHFNLNPPKPSEKKHSLDNQEDVEDKDEDYEDEEDEEEDGSMDDEEHGHDHDDEEGKDGGKSKIGLATCSVTIFAGSCSDPSDIQGLAHLVEHVIFLGSKEYPESDAYTKFMSKHGGYDNAYTSNNSTTYEFDIDNAYLGEALYRFSRLMKEPILGSEGISKEVQAINNEFDLAVVDEDIQRFQAITNSFDDNFPLKTFGWGNAASLSRDEKELQDGVRRFYESYYNSDKMKVCIQANYALDELEEMIKKSFNDLELKKECLSSRIVQQEELEVVKKKFPGFYYMKTTSQVEKLTFSWAIDSLNYEYESFPLDLILAILSEKGEGSLYYVLKEKNLITDMGAETNSIDGQENEYLYLPWLIMKLTNYGIDNIDQILKYTGEYLNMIKKTAIPDYYIKEAIVMSQLEFKYADEIAEDQLANALSHAMKYIPKERLLEAGVFRVPRTENRELLNKILESFTLHNSRIDIQTPEISEKWREVKLNPEIEFEHQEKYFGVKSTSLCLKKLLGEQVYESIKEGHFGKEFYFPEKNELIPENALMHDLIEEYKIPKEIVGSEKKLQCWYSIDPNYRIPKVNVNVIMFFRLKKSAIINSYMELLEGYIKDEFAKSLYSKAKTAGFECSISKHEYCGLEIGVYGFSDKMVLLYTIILEFFYNAIHNLKEETFNLIKEKKLKQYEKILDEPETYIKRALMKALFDFSMMPEEKIEFFEKTCNFQEFKAFCLSLSIPNAVSRIKLHSHGNLTIEDLNNLSNTLHEEIEKNNNDNLSSTLAASFLLEGNQISKGGLRKIIGYEKLPIAKMKAHLKDGKTNLVLFLVELGQDNIKNRILCQLLNQMFNTEIFEDLRGKQDIGYISNSYCLDFPGLMVGLEIWVSSSKLTSKEITEKIVEFINRFLGEFLDSKTEEEFNETKQSEISIKMKPFQNISETGEHYWNEIKHGLYNMNRKQEEIDFLKKIEFGEFKKWVITQFMEKKWLSLELDKYESIKDENETSNLEEMNKLSINYNNIHEYSLE